MWERERKDYVDAVETMEKMENVLVELENQFSGYIMNSMIIDDPKFNEGYDIDLIELENKIYNLRELINQYIKEQDEYYGKNDTEIS